MTDTATHDSSAAENSEAADAVMHWVQRQLAFESLLTTLHAGHARNVAVGGTDDAAPAQLPGSVRPGRAARATLDCRIAPA